MSESPETNRSPEQVVRTAVAAAEATRRGREADRRLWRAAPVVAAVCLAAAVATRWAGFGPAIPLVLMAFGVLGLALDGYVQRRRRPISDTAAARIDTDGDFGGELRSASWFAARDDRDEWAAFHVDRAAARLAVVDWTHQYPVVRARRAQFATAAILVAAVALALSFPGRASVRANAVSTTAAKKTALAGRAGARIELLPEDLRKQLEDLIAAAEKGALSGEQQKRAIDLWNLFAQVNADLDEETLKALAKAMDPSKLGSADQAAKNLMDLAGRALKAADAKAASPDAQKALENLGAQLADAAIAEQQAANESQSASGQSPGKDAQAANAASSDAPPKLDQSSIQFSKDSEPGAGAGMMMMSQQIGPKGQPSSGFGGAGNSGAPPNGGIAPELEQALRRETIEASEDTSGDNVLSETRRKTEHGQATVAFTHSAAGSSARSRASAPPPVPEGRRAAVQNYFTRKQ